MRISGRDKQGAQKSQRSKREHQKTHKFLKPGALVQLRDARMVPRASCTTIGRKRVVGMDGDCNPENVAENGQVNSEMQCLFSSERVSGDSVASTASECPQRKKSSAPLTPSTPAAQFTVAGFVEEEVVKRGGDSLLEDLPLELLVRIVCCLHHDQLKPVFHVCRRLQRAVMIAKQCHFNFTTPNRERQENLGLLTPQPGEHWPFASELEAHGPIIRPATPRAPRHPPKLLQARLSVAELRQVAASLFQEPTSNLPLLKPANLSRAAFRGVASHRVLFYEEELCQAVSQNSI